MKKKLFFGLQGKMVFSYSIILVAAIVLLMGTAYRYLVAVSAQNAEITRQQLADKTLAQVENYLLEMDKTAQQVCADTRIINIFHQLYQERPEENYFEKNIMESIDIATVLASINGPGDPIWRISLFNERGDFISTGANISQSDIGGRMQRALTIDELIRQSAGGKTKRIITLPETDHWSDMYGQTKFISLYRPVTDYYGRQFYGIVEIQQNIDKLEPAILLDARTNTLVFLFDGDKNQILPQDTQFDSVDKSGYHITWQASPEYGWAVALAQSGDEIIGPYKSLIGFLFIGGAVLIVGVLMLVYFASRRFSKPIIELSKKVGDISIGSIPPTLSTDGGTDELRELNSAFTFMLKRLQDSISVEQRAYLLALQSQMDPHFLYNSLSVISGMGLEAGNDKIVDACDKLGSMLRYSATYDTKDTVLRNEIIDAQNYLELMKLRYEEYFTYTIDVDERLTDMPIPRLTLQPIVENCFEHGFKGTPMPWEIHIKAIIVDGRWQIAITDNGKGFSADSLEELERKAEAYSSDLSSNYQEMKLGGMGLINTIVRLKLSMNEELEYSINNLEPCGAEVKLKGGAYDTHIDR